MQQSHDIHVLYDQYISKYKTPKTIGEKTSIEKGNENDEYYNVNVEAVVKDFEEKMGEVKDEYAKNQLRVIIMEGMI
jgi:peptidoglycan hydrolase-like protein with peptidoglycan-binding domain